MKYVLLIMSLACLVAIGTVCYEEYYFDVNASTYNPKDKIKHTYEAGADGNEIVLENSVFAFDPTYEEVMAFVLQDDTDKQAYIPGSFVCADFAERLHNNAEANGIRAGWVTIDLVGSIDGHVCNVFNTTDAGQVFIDCTGPFPYEQGNWDGVVKVKKGTEYIPRPIINDGMEYDSMGTVKDYKIYW